MYAFELKIFEWFENILKLLINDKYKNNNKKIIYNNQKYYKSSEDIKILKT